MNNRIGGSRRRSRRAPTSSRPTSSRASQSRTTRGQAHPDRVEGPRRRETTSAKKRTKAEAEALVKSLVAQIKAGADFDMLMKQHSEDPGSASTGRAYTVSPDAQLVIEFKQLALRLNVG